MSTILIARHGNTFEPEQQVVRVGLKSDLPLAKSGQQQAQRLGAYIAEHKISLAAVFSSTLQRTIKSAELALQSAQLELPITKLNIFDEIDYGCDEGKPESEVVARLGTQALVDWDERAIVPPGWLVDPQALIDNWQNFATEVATLWPQQTVLVVTSNGIARFAPYITNDYEGFRTTQNIKLATGALGSLSNKKGHWEVDFWNIRP